MLHFMGEGTAWLLRLADMYWTPTMPQAPPGSRDSTAPASRNTVGAGGQRSHTGCRARAKCWCP